MELKILLFPWLAHGHVNPFLELGKQLSRRNFTTFLCSTPINLSYIPTTQSEVHLIELHMPPSPELPPELHTTRNLPAHLNATLMRSFQSCDAAFSEVLASLKPDLLIFDLYQPWAAKLARSVGIPSVFFATTSATIYSFYHYIYTYGSPASFPFPAISLEDQERIKPADLKKNVKGDVDGFAFGTFDLSEIVLVKDCREVEAKYIDLLSDLSGKRIVSTGALIGESPEEENSSEFIDWLNQKPPFSTLYISFGSECFPSGDQIRQIAEALQQQSNLNFLWVIRFPPQDDPSSLEESLPEGFLRRIETQGSKIATEWVPQKQILAHQSIAAFVSHCGWGSITESLYFGVPIVAMPMNADQPVNARFIVDEGVGAAVERKGKEIYRAEAIARAINSVVYEDSGLKNRAVELSKIMRNREEAEINGVATELRNISIETKTSPGNGGPST